MTLWAPNFNGAEIMRAGMALVPDLAGQQMQRRNLELQAEALQLQQQQEARQLTEANRKFERTQKFQTAVAEFKDNPTPGAVSRLMVEYPELSEGLKRGWDTLSDEKKARDMGQLGEIYSYLANGNVERAKAALRGRVEAEKAAGLEADEAAMLEDLEGGDPEAVKGVMASLVLGLSIAAGPDKFASAFGALTPEKSALEKESRYIASVDGEDAAKKYRRNSIDPLVTITNQDGTTMAPRSYLEQAYGSGGGAAPVAQQAPSTKGGLPAGKPVANAGSVAQSLFPGVEVTQVRRDPNSALGKKNPKSWHNRTGAAVDVAPIANMTFGQYVQRYKDAGYAILEQRDEVKNPSGHATGPHWHIVLGGGPAAEKVPTRVMTRQQFNKLPSGTEFIAPDGTRRRKP